MVGNLVLETCYCEAAKTSFKQINENLAQKPLNCYSYHCYYYTIQALNHNTAVVLRRRTAPIIQIP